MSDLMWSELQAEVKEWSSRNFPNAGPHVPLLGMVEELGELSQAKDRREKMDAIGDVMIFAADYCWKNGLDLGECVAFSYSRGLDWMPAIHAIGNLAHAHIKGEEGIRYIPEVILEKKMAAMSYVLSMLESVAGGEALLRRWTCRTWAEVKQRDWVANPLGEGYGKP